MSVNKTNEENFDQDVINSEVPVMVDFYADWCGPCKALAPILDELSTETGAKIYKVNVDDNPNLTTKYGIRGIPTSILFDKGVATKTIVGIKSKAEIKNWLTDV